MKSKFLLLLVFYSLSLGLIQPACADDSAAANSTKNSLAKLSAQIAVIDRDRILKLADAALALRPPHEGRRRRARRRLHAHRR